MPPVAKCGSSLLHEHCRQRDEQQSLAEIYVDGGGQLEMPASTTCMAESLPIAFAPVAQSVSAPYL